MASSVCSVPSVVIPYFTSGSEGSRQNQDKVRDREDAIASTRDACATQKLPFEDSPQRSRRPQSKAKATECCPLFPLLPFVKKLFFQLERHGREGRKLDQNRLLAPIHFAASLFTPQDFQRCCRSRSPHQY